MYYNKNPINILKQKKTKLWIVLNQNYIKNIRKDLENGVPKYF